MVLSIIASLPVDSRFVPTCLENIIDKRVAGVALNFLERLFNWLCTWLYFPYNTLYKAKMVRVHTFSDGIVRLFDATVRGLAGIEHDWEHDYVTLHDRNVRFNLNPNIKNHFARAMNTDYVVVRDDPIKRINWYQIIEQEISRPENPKPMEKIWYVDANKVHRFEEEQSEDVFLAEPPRGVSPRIR